MEGKLVAGYDANNNLSCIAYNNSLYIFKNEDTKRAEFFLKYISLFYEKGLYEEYIDIMRIKNRISKTNDKEEAKALRNIIHKINEDKEEAVLIEEFVTNKEADKVVTIEDINDFGEVIVKEQQIKKKGFLRKRKK